MFEIDNLTLVLLVALLALALYARAQKTPLVHPLLLGKQAEPGPVRREGETAVYRAFATGHGTPLQVRPANTVKTVNDVVASKPGVERVILDTNLTDDGLAEITRLLPLGLRALFPTPGPIVTLLPPSPSTSLPLLLLSLSASPGRPLVVLPAPVFLTAALTSAAHTRPAVVVVHASIAEDVVEQIWEDCGADTGVLLVGDGARTLGALVDAARARGMRAHWWDDLWDAAGAPDTAEPEQAGYADTHSFFYSGSPESPVVVKLTHLNFTAGMAGLLSLFPADKRPSSAQKDVVASAVSLATPLGMTIALASVWSGAGLRLIGPAAATWPTDEDGDEGAAETAELEALVAANQLKPTILFLSAAHHAALLARLHAALLVTPLAALAVRHRLPDLRAGHVARGGLLDSLVFKKVRAGALGGLGEGVRAVIVVGDAPAPEALARSHVLLSLPLTRLHPSAFSAGPVFVSHFNDVQSPVVPDLFRRVAAAAAPSDEKTALAARAARVHCGPPASNIEVVLRAPSAGDAHHRGRIWVRGPTVGLRAGADEGDGWVDIGEDAEVQTNGTFVVG
ncbi:hypothetical protein Q5752_001170 [Cryptotrichosporon argae]